MHASHLTMYKRRYKYYVIVKFNPVYIICSLSGWKREIFHLSPSTHHHTSLLCVENTRYGGSFRWIKSQTDLPAFSFFSVYLFFFFCTGFLLRKIKQHTSDQILWARQHSLMEMFWPENFEIMKLLKARIANYLIYADPFTDFPKKHSKFSNFLHPGTPFYC